MSISKYNEFSNLTEIPQINDEIFLLKKYLFELRLKRFSNQNIKSHLFKHAKRKIAQLNFKKSILLTK
jgi:ribosomal protein L29